jgi:hypothetical protein
MASKGKVWVLPVYFVQHAELVPTKTAPPTVRITVLDVFNDPVLCSLLDNSLATHFGPDVVVERLRSVDDVVSITLVLNKDKHGILQPLSQPVPLHRSRGRRKHVLEFALPPTKADAPTPSVPDFDLHFQERVRALFRTDDVDASVHLSQETGLKFQNLISPSTHGEKPVVLVVAGGTTNGRSSIKQLFQSLVQVDIRVRRGVEPNMALISTLAEHLFDGIHVERFASERQNENTVMAFVLPNGTRVVDTWAHFNEILHDQGSEHTEEEEKATGTSEGSSNSVGGSKSGNFGFANLFSAGSSKAVNVAWERTNSQYNASKLGKADRKELKKALAGQIPASMMKVDQIQELANRCRTTWEVKLGSFRRGEATFPSKQSLQTIFLAASMERLQSSKTQLEDVLQKTTAAREAAELADKKLLAQQLRTLAGNMHNYNTELREKEAHVHGWDSFFEAFRHIDTIGWYKFNAIGGSWDCARDHMLDNHRGAGGQPLRQILDLDRARISVLKKAIENTGAAINALEATASTRSAEVQRLLGEEAKLHAQIANAWQEMVAISR